jgi:hypothetical protein
VPAVCMLSALRWPLGNGGIQDQVPRPTSGSEEFVAPHTYMRLGPATSCAITRTGQKPKSGSTGIGQYAPPPGFFFMCWHGRSKQHFRSKTIAPKSWWSCLQRLQTGVRQLTGGHSTLTLEFFRAISAGGCLVVSTAALCAAVVENYYVAHLACCFIQ